MDAAPPDVARPLWLRVAGEIEAKGVRTALGEFGAEMQVELVNDGPFTIWLDTRVR
jgi:D-tyrosyl-tRNA(Tyr) deacylase